MNRLGVVALAWGCFLAGCLIGAMVSRPESDLVYRSDANVVATRIADIRADPDRFAGKTVRLNGRLTECFGWECSLCSEDKVNMENCLPLSFRPIMPRTGFGGDAKEDIFRFASVTLTARFEPDCLHPGRCTDRQTTLFDADVLAVTRRRTARAGLWIDSQTKLVPADASTARRIADAGVPADYSPETPRAAFLVEGRPNEAIACIWPTGIAPVSWPASLEAALYAKTINDFYNCSKLAKNEGHWRPSI